MAKIKKQTAVKGASPALLISIAIHVLLFFVAGAFVAVEVIQRQEAKFEGKQIVRPKMKLKKLQVPVKIEKQVKRQAPKLSQRVTSSAPTKTKSVDFKMPEMSGFGGSARVDVGSGGFGGSLGFATTQLNVFGLKSRGEKILFMLDTTNNMLSDDIGGIPAYTVIKKELITLIGNLPPTALFNVVVFEQWNQQVFSKEMSTASDANIKKFTEWLEPLNGQKNKVGLKTLASPGFPLEFESLPPVYSTPLGWVRGLCYGVQKGVDTIYWLGHDDHISSVPGVVMNAYKAGREPTKEEWATSKGSYDFLSYKGGKAAWEQLILDAREAYEAENARRAAEGRPMKVIGGHGADHEGSLVTGMFPKAEQPDWLPPTGMVTYSGTDLLKYMEDLGAKYTANNKRSASIGLKKKKQISFNVIHFVPQDKDKIRSLRSIKYVAEQLKGEYLQIKGLRAIESAASAR